MQNNFQDRLEWLLNGRKIHKWGAAIGLTKTVITRLNQGIFPGADKLRPIVRQENISLTWFVEGKGQKCLINNCFSDQDCYECLLALYDESWKTYILADGFNIAIVLTQPGSYEIDGENYLNTIIEVITGPVSDKTISLVLQKNNDINTFFVQTNIADMQDLYKGNIGTFGLLQTTDALLNKAQLLKQKNLQSLMVENKVAEKLTSYRVEGKISSEEMATVEDMRQLTPQNLSHIRAVIHSLSNKPEKPKKKD